MENLYKAKDLIQKELNIANNLATGQLAELAQMFANEGLTLNDTHFQKFMEDRSIQGHREDHDEPGYIGGLLLDIARADVERARIQSERIRIELLRKATAYPIEKFAVIQRAIEGELYKWQFEVTDFTFKDGKPEVSKPGKERIEAKYTLFLNDEEKAFWQCFTDFCAALDRLQNQCKANGRELFMLNIEVSPEWITRTPDGIQPNPRAFLKEKNNLTI